MMTIALDVAPQTPTVDDRLSIAVRGLPPAGAIELIATSTTGDRGQEWSSNAKFRADEFGQLDLTRTAPLDGSYSGIDPMGLFWSMTPRTPSVPAEKQASPPALLPDLRTTISVVGSGPKLVGGATFVRHIASPTVEVLPLRDPLYGSLFHVPGQPGPPVIVLGGSEGGYPAGVAALLARRGFSALALAYLGVPSLNRARSRIPIEYLLNAIEWLRARPEVLPSKVGLVGSSRGGELALLAALASADVGAVVVISGTAIRLQADTASGWLTPRAAWTMGGKPIECLALRQTMHVFADVAAAMSDGRRPIEMATHWRRRLSRASRMVERATIPTDRIQCPLQFHIGADDRLVPSNDLCSQVRSAPGIRAPEIHIYPEAGHIIRPGFLPFESTETLPRVPVPLALGGTPLGAAMAGDLAWRRMRSFLEELLCQ